MIVLVINAGSSSVKFTLFRKDGDLEVMAEGIVERIGLRGTLLRFRNERGDKIEREVAVTGTTQAVEVILASLLDRESGVVYGLDEITAVGHRVVHGGEAITRSIIIDDSVKAIIRECAELAPLHNPPNLAGIEACEKLIPGIPHVAVMDTAFHTTIPPHAYLYGIPYRYYRDFKIRRYGFHGTSHKYVSSEAARYLGVPVENLKIVTCHLGNGCSMTAVNGGVSVDTSLGFTPLEGLVMGTRCGDIDPAIIVYLLERKLAEPGDLDRILNKESGLLGVAEIGSSDMRDVAAAASRGNRQAQVAERLFCYRVKKYIGAYAAVMGGLDVLVFTAGIGENSPRVRRLVCEGLGGENGLGVTIDDAKNEAPGTEVREIQGEGRVKVLVVPTNEELEIARQTVGLLGEHVPSKEQRGKP